MRQDGHTWTAGRIIFRQNRPAQQSLRAEPREIVARHVLSIRRIGGPGSGDVVLIGRKCDQVGKLRQVLAEELVGGIGEGSVNLAALLVFEGISAVTVRPDRAIPLPNPGQDTELFGMADGERLQQQRVRDAEDAGVRADPQPERDHRDGGESRVLAQDARRVAKVLQESLKECPAPHAAYLLLYESHVAESAAGGIARLFRSQPGIPLLFSFQFQVGAQLTVEILLAGFRAAPTHFSAPRQAT